MKQASKKPGARDVFKKIKRHGIRGIAKMLIYRSPVPLRRRVLRLHALLQRRRMRSKQPTLQPQIPSIYNGSIEGLISIVLPVYNHAHHLDVAIAGVLAQSYQNFELIIINDGSTDDFREVVEQYALHPKISIYEQENLGLPAALSNGFRMARGQYYTWTSADNVMMPKQLEMLYNFLEKNSDVDMVYSNYRIIDDKGNPATNTDFRMQDQSFMETDLIITPAGNANSLEDNNFIGPSFMYRSYVAKMVGPYSGELGAEDYDYWLRIYSQFRIAHLDSSAALYKYRVHNDSLSGRAHELKIYDKVAKLKKVNRKRDSYMQLIPELTIIGGEIESLSELHRSDISIHRSDVLPARCDKTGKNIYLIVNPHKMKRQNLDKFLSLKNPTTFFAAYFSERISFSEPALPLIKDFDLTLTTEYINFGIIRSISPKVFAIDDSSLLDVLLRSANYELSSRLFATGCMTPQKPELYRPRPINVIFETKTLDKGGLEVTLSLAARNLDPKRFKPIVVVVEKNGLTGKDLAKRIPVYLLDSSNPKNHYRSIIKKHESDIIYSYYSDFARINLSDIEIPIIESVHNTYSWFTPQMKELFRKNSDRVCCYPTVSAKAADYLVQNLEIDPNKMSIIPNSFDAKGLVPNPDINRRSLGYAGTDYVLLNVASVYPPKAQLALIRALSMVHNPAVKALIVGDIYDQNYYELCLKQIKKYKLEKRIKFIPYNTEIASYYELADLFVLPSYLEGWSLAANEAAYFGLPMVLSQAGGAQQQIPGPEYGYIIPNPADDLRLGSDELFDLMLSLNPINATDLASAINDAFNNRQRWSERRDKIKGHILDYSIKKVIKLHEEVIISNLKHNK